MFLDTKIPLKLKQRYNSKKQRTGGDNNGKNFQFISLVKKQMKKG